jgi:ribonuclease P protein component
MLKRAYRLKGSDRFLEIKRSGKSSMHPLMVLTILPNELSYNRFGFVVSRRVGGAVVRNRVRRLMQEAVRLRWPELMTGYDAVLTARPAICRASFAEVDQAFGALARRAGLMPQLEPAQDQGDHLL